MGSFFLMGAKPLVHASPTMKLHELLDWSEIAHKPKGLHKREATHGGRPEHKVGGDAVWGGGQTGNDGLGAARRRTARRAKLPEAAAAGQPPMLSVPSGGFKAPDSQTPRNPAPKKKGPLQGPWADQELIRRGVNGAAGNPAPAEPALTEPGCQARGR